jgi:hypothetical protein
MSASDKKKILKLAGKVKWVGDLDEMRQSRVPESLTVKKSALKKLAKKNPPKRKPRKNDI